MTAAMKTNLKVTAGVQGGSAEDEDDYEVHAVAVAGDRDGPKIRNQAIGSNFTIYNQDLIF